MSTEKTDAKHSQEIDLSFLSQHTSNFFNGISSGFFRMIQFLMKNYLIVLGLLIVGGGLGFFLDSKKEGHYKHEIIVVPNFNSTTYLYKNVENFDNKGSMISKMEVSPIINVYGFITERYGNLEIAQYLGENNIQLEKYKPKSDIEKFYRYHLLTIETKTFDKDGKIVQGFLDQLNKDPYFLERKKIEQKTTQERVSQNELSINQLNSIFNKMGSEEFTAQSGMNVEMYSELNNLFNSKKSIMEDINNTKVQSMEQNEIIYTASKIINIKNDPGYFKFILPVLFIILYLMLTSILKGYKKFAKKAQTA